MWQGGVLKEIEPPEKLGYTFAWESRGSVGLPESPFKENLITVRFEERKGDDHDVYAGSFATEGERDGHNGGWNSAFDRFAELVEAQAVKGVQ